MTAPKFLRRGLIALISFEFGLALAYMALIFRRGEAISLLDFNGLRSLPSLLQAAHLFAIGGLCGLLLVARQHRQQPYSWFLPAALMLFCCFCGIDELTKLHLALNQVNWQVVYLSLMAAILIFSWGDFIWLWRHHRPTLLWVLAGISLFLLGSFGGEMLKDPITNALNTHSPPRIAFLLEHVRILVEEFSELMGETLILYAFAKFTWGVWSQPKTVMS
ncbi:MAG: hypothetical protein AAGH67_16845 [Cyanobacteria bacterium P01_H01_bin.162]